MNTKTRILSATSLLLTTALLAATGGGNQPDATGGGGSSGTFTYDTFLTDAETADGTIVHDGVWTGFVAETVTPPASYASADLRAWLGDAGNLTAYLYADALAADASFAALGVSGTNFIFRAQDAATAGVVTATLQYCTDLSDPDWQDVAADDIVDESRYELVRKDGTRVGLSARELALLRTFAAQAGNVLTRDYLLNTVWGVSYFGSTRTLDQHIALLPQSR